MYFNLLGEASRASRPKKRTASEDGGKDKKKKKVCKRRRTAFTKSQTALLESVFVKNPYPEAHIREELSRLTGISVEQIQVIKIIKVTILLYMYCRSGSKIVGRVFVSERVPDNL